MFGILRPCRHRLSAALRTSWWAHLCGLCYALRDEHGQLARVATNYDGLIISGPWSGKPTGACGCQWRDECCDCCDCCPSHRP